MAEPALWKCLERRVGALERTLSAMEERFKSADTALKLQTKNYDDHFAHLNNKTAEQARIQDTYLPRETYEADRRLTVALAFGVAGALLSSFVAILIAVLR